MLEAWSARRSMMMNNRQEIVIDAVLSAQFSADPLQLLRNFQTAESQDLLRSYVIGFTSLVLAAEAADPDGRHRTLKETEDLAEKEYRTATSNRHRAKAFPAVAAAHILPTARDHDLSLANDLIVQALVWPQREIQEIVCQNLVCSLTRDDHAWAEFLVADIVLDTLGEYVLSRRLSNPLINTGACIALQFLTYYDLALDIRVVPGVATKTVTRQRDLIGQIFRHVHNANDPYAWLVRSWLSELQTLSGRAAHRGNPAEAFRQLPPQATELVMGWRHCATTNHEWFNSLALAVTLQALLLHFNSLIVADKADDRVLKSLIQQDYGLKEAEVAKIKLERWFKDMRLSNAVFGKAMQHCEQDLGTTLQQLERETAADVESSETHPEWSLVPFRDFQNPVLHIPARPSEDKVDRLLTALISGSVGVLLRELFDLAEIYWQPSRDRTPPDIDRQVQPTWAAVEKVIKQSETTVTLESMRSYFEGDATALWANRSDRSSSEQ